MQPLLTVAVIAKDEERTLPALFASLRGLSRACPTQFVLVDTGSGDVEVALVSDTDDIMVDTGSGNVTVTVPPGYGSAVNLSTSSGDVDTDVEIQVTRRGRQHLVGRIGDGQGRMTIETGSGNVTIRGSR